MDRVSGGARAIRVEALSCRYEARRLTEGDLSAVYALCRGNPLYYAYCPSPVSERRIAEDADE